LDLGLYIHIPFCRKKCDYCNFYSIPLINNSSSNKTKIIDDYIRALLFEIRERSFELNNYTVDTIYFGGGTPSLLSPDQISTLLNEIYCYFKIHSNDLEISIECNPDDFSIKKIDEYKKTGVNRVVLGVQTLSERLHSILGRSASLCGKRLLSEFISIQNIAHCIDLIIGIPGQTENDLLQELYDVTSCGFEHISAYTLSIEKDTPISKRITTLHSLNDFQRILLEKTIDIFTAAGYLHYEVSNYARPSYASKHNLKYWKFLPYAGFGSAAHSFYNGERYYNIKSVEEYIRNTGNIRQKDIRTKNSEIVEYLMSGMRLTEGISIKDFEDKINITIPKDLLNKLNIMKIKGLLEIKEEDTDKIIRFTKAGFFQMDNLIYEMTEIFL